MKFQNVWKIDDKILEDIVGKYRCKCVCTHTHRVVKGFSAYEEKEKKCLHAWWISTFALFCLLVYLIAKLFESGKQEFEGGSLLHQITT